MSTCSGAWELPGLPGLKSSHSGLPATRHPPPASNQQPQPGGGGEGGGGAGGGGGKWEGTAEERKGEGRRRRNEKDIPAPPLQVSTPAVQKLLLRRLKDSVPTSDCTPPGFQVIYSQTTPVALKTGCSFAEPGRDLPKEDIRTVVSIPSRKTKNKSYCKLNNKRSSIKAHTYK